MTNKYTYIIKVIIRGTRMDSKSYRNVPTLAMAIAKRVKCCTADSRTFAIEKQPGLKTTGVVNSIRR